MTRSLEDYRRIVGEEVVSMIHRKTRRLYGKHILHINSTYQGGGVAEMLSSLVPVMNDAGIDTGWRILHGNPDFFTITKKFYNALQGGRVNLSEIKKRLYIQANEDFSTYTHVDHDCVIIHDPQPLPLIKLYKKRQPWIWRCHVDLSNPHEGLWNFLENYILRYDVVILSNEEYRRKDLPVEQRIIYPAIDPLSSKNKEIGDEVISKYLRKFGIPGDKPLVTQISRFDRWKDPVGVIEVFKLVKEKVDCRLVLCGNMAMDDPEGWKIYEKVERKNRRLVKNRDIMLITSENNILVNALQRSSAVIIQKSIREGFGLTVTESLWKGRPVVASNVGGIPLQIKDGENGFLLEPNDTKGFANRMIEILQNPDTAEEMGRKGKEIVREKFLITRLLSDYLDLLNDVMK
ncbi:glycosyl transferase family 1 [candidate division WOR-3 bacterium JGI_Cruoil_03_44_89]|uniref:Glycosyl transferase family 1 n=1 Tax=candidate division WOR-3 bacterium JGI_Cruoil_03_44_89 TaxID=1973748 RepID=A0A235BNL0_UNCW3|nr:MAG: glycosyl transferase family 1 [candidate division WOR-3 bacterium JGI_Cruoil_03_44_89]